MSFLVLRVAGVGLLGELLSDQSFLCQTPSVKRFSIETPVGADLKCKNFPSLSKTIDCIWVDLKYRAACRRVKTGCLAKTTSPERRPVSTKVKLGYDGINCKTFFPDLPLALKSLTHTSAKTGRSIVFQHEIASIENMENERSVLAVA